MYQHSLAFILYCFRLLPGNKSLNFVQKNSEQISKGDKSFPACQVELEQFSEVQWVCAALERTKMLLLPAVLIKLKQKMLDNS